MRHLNHWIGRLGCWLQSPFLLIMRVVWGGAFILSGIGKLMNVATVSAFFQGLGLPFPTFHAYLVGTVELVGGALLFIGLYARLAGMVMAIVMATAYALAHREALVMIFNNPSLFAEQGPFNFLVVSLIVWLFGPGSLSLDRWLGRCSGPSACKDKKDKKG